MDMRETDSGMVDENGEALYIAVGYKRGRGPEAFEAVEVDRYDYDFDGHRELTWSKFKTAEDRKYEEDLKRHYEMIKCRAEHSVYSPATHGSVGAGANGSSGVLVIEPV